MRFAHTVFANLANGAGIRAQTGLKLAEKYFGARARATSLGGLFSCLLCLLARRFDWGKRRRPRHGCWLIIGRVASERLQYQKELLGEHSDDLVVMTRIISNSITSAG